MTGWERLCESNRQIAPFIEVGVEWAKLYYSQMDNTRTYIIAMCELNIPSGFRYKQNSLNVQMKEYCDMKIAWPEELQCSSEPNLYNVLAEEVGAMDMSTKSSTPHGFQDVGQEYRAYIDNELLNRKQDPLKFWEVNRTRLPTLFAITMDYLPIQASSMPCERVFSSSTETDTKKCNRIGPTLMEALQMLKYHLKKMWLNFCANWSITHENHVEDEPKEPDDGGMKQHGDFDIHDHVEDLV
ncbi:hypothetical protein SCLCIDRAFT_144617 [Scleroderma citrinum Foug A]|uniref:HAT C-terminal dimerisation domain-containing protein n=1 Tax=Scleroderma citrinum Foug A TaxID=1036808 RepID=A0A0C2YM09_9AGAM|nr:hypothetical protein SCLCIDRAFT_144617 [Scleroderma citrinum Foug A]